MTVQIASSVRPSAMDGAVAGHVAPRLAGQRGRLDLADTTEGLLCRRDALPMSHPDRAVLRARVIEENLPLARRLARRYAGRGEPFEDLAQVAAVALIKAVDGYDSARPNLFISYAIPSIIGALKRHFRDTTWGMNVPRSMQELVQSVWSSSAALAQRFGRVATSAELAADLDLTLDQLVAVQMATQAYRPASLDASLAQTDAIGGSDLLRVLGQTDPRYAAVDDHVMLVGLIAALPERDRRIMRMRFDDEMTQSQIAVEIGVSQMQVSRLLRQSLAEMQRAMSRPISRRGPSGP